jgi:two-component system, NarL family, sensor histidine kinase UhpB
MALFAKARRFRRRTSIHAPLHAPFYTGRKSMVRWRRHLLDALWFRRSVRSQILMVFIAVNLIAALIGGAVIVYMAGVSTRIEIAASMRLAEFMASEAVQLIAQGMPADQFLGRLPAQLRLVRHVRIGVRGAPAPNPDASGGCSGVPMPDGAAARSSGAREGGRPDAPRWFAALIGPPVECHAIPVAANGAPTAIVEIVSEPRDEIAEAWENSVALFAVAAITVLVLTAILYLVLGRVLDPLTALGSGLFALERRDFKLRLARPKVLEFAAITDRFNALAGALEDARRENLALNRRLITAQDDERRRTALELHDEVGPSLFGLKANAASIIKAAHGLPQAAAATVAARAGDLSAIVDHLQGINRAILNRLRPMALGHVPLGEILAELVGERARAHPDIDFDGEFGCLARGYGDTVDLTVYRCVQESLTNAIRHAGARQIGVRVANVRTPQDGTERLELTISDDGSGIAAGVAQGFGLRGMRERVEALGGAFAVESAVDRGTCVRITIAVPGLSARPEDASQADDGGRAP